MNLNLLRRKYRILFLIGVTGGIYLCFQIFSMKVLNLAGQRESRSQALRSGKVFDDFPDVVDSQVVERPVDYGQVESKNDLNKDKGIVQRNPDTQSEHFKLVLGTLVSMSEDYKPVDGMFRCLQSKELFPYSAVNDDYCDCSDSTDEPGTSACPHSKFYCTFQPPDMSVMYLPGSRVNDGVCDCCDGSDEWGGVKVSSGVHFTGKKFSGTLKHTPCNNTCNNVMELSKEDAKIRALGKKIKQMYLEAGRSINNPELYGPGSVFFKLSQACYEFDMEEYKYKLCPFRSATQQKHHATGTNIGSHPVWRARLPGHYELKMDRGDASRCPLGQTRNTVILFICGLTDKIVEVTENERCAYHMRFATPAAC
ncbi:glucosidase 2 subunit beta-like [Mya arenaria]|uniref:glucosidase 2 subunit beta-like n=1 Tax=Mya arenaria TaxID=6604 RepID=UPI0022E27F39|nr:glucosidase 2 subunit beta-like [Mya arenaria]XP_052762698.1 glucosidase 2 subunit beta-like [Mya arenaria]